MNWIIQVMTYWELRERAYRYHDWVSVDLWDAAIERCLECWE